MRPDRFVPVEGLRALAALCVLGGHVWIHSQAGQGDLGRLNEWLLPYLPTGLTLFFAISGFLLWMRFAAGVLDDKAVSAREYARRRLMRIGPAYWVILLLVALVLGAAHLQDGDSVGYLTDPGLLTANLLLVQNYGPDGVTTGIGPSWSLAVEVIFYISLPLLALSARRLAPRIGPVAATLAPAAALFAIGIVGKATAERTLESGDTFSQRWGATWHAVLERSFLTSADLFAFGMVAAVVLLLVRRDRLQVSRRAIGAAAVVLAAVAIVAEHRGTLDRYFDTWMSLACALLLLYVTLPGRERSVSRLLEVRPIVYIGLISYSIYLWHEPLIYWLRDHGLLLEGQVGLVANAVIVIGAVVAFGSVTFWLVEKPAMDRNAPVPTHSPTMEAAP